RRHGHKPDRASRDLPVFIVAGFAPYADVDDPMPAVRIVFVDFFLRGATLFVDEHGKTHRKCGEEDGWNGGTGLRIERWSTRRLEDGGAWRMEEIDEGGRHFRSATIAARFVLPGEEKDVTADFRDAVTSRWQKAERQDRHSLNHTIEVMRFRRDTGKRLQDSTKLRKVGNHRFEDSVHT
ncbi:MAG: hypothetical protein Q9191_005660, partial [Dirinaria sp. TL-2023a]